MKKDNSTLTSKIKIRRSAITKLNKKAFILETHGGEGKVFELVYRDFDGVVFEKDSAKINILAKQRPTWRVYEQDCLQSISDGACDDLEINFIDVDPYGDPWPVITEIFNSKIKFIPPVAICVNDGLRRKAQVGGFWNCETLKPLAIKYGNTEIYQKYIEVCRELMDEKAANAGLSVDGWHANYCGKAGGMTHYAAILR